jgi:hypothetical protein
MMAVMGRGGGGRGRADFGIGRSEAARSAERVTERALLQRLGEEYAVVGRDSTRRD